MEEKSSLNAFVQRFVKLAAKYVDAYCLTVDSEGVFGLGKFSAVFEERMISCGLGVENALGMACGMALRGKMPFVFVPAHLLSRGADVIKNQLCLHNLNVKIISVGAGFENSFGGAPMQVFDDLALFRNFPNMKIVAPMDGAEADAICEKLYNDFGPCYVRLSNIGYPIDQKIKVDFRFGESEILRGGRDGTIFSFGSMAFEMLELAQVLDEDYRISLSVVNVSSIKPLHEKLILQKARKAPHVFVIEDHFVAGGLGDLICDLLVKNSVETHFHKIAFADTFGRSGSRAELLAHFKMDTENLVKRVLKLMG
jgi:transketolase